MKTIYKMVGGVLTRIYTNEDFQSYQEHCKKQKLIKREDLEEGLEVKFVPKGPRDKYYAEAMKNAGQVVAIHSLTCDYGDHDEDKQWCVIAFLEDIGDGWMEVHLEDLEKV